MVDDDADVRGATIAEPRDRAGDEDADELAGSPAPPAEPSGCAPRVERRHADTVRMYLREIGQVDLLTTDDERRLAQLIEEGNHAARTHRRGASPTSRPSERRC